MTASLAVNISKGISAAYLSFNVSRLEYASASVVCMVNPSKTILESKCPALWLILTAVSSLSPVSTHTCTTKVKGHNIRQQFCPALLTASIKKDNASIDQVSNNPNKLKLSTHSADFVTNNCWIKWHRLWAPNLVIEWPNYCRYTCNTTLLDCHSSHCIVGNYIIFQRLQCTHCTKFFPQDGRD